MFPLTASDAERHRVLSQIEQTSLEFKDPKLERVVTLTPADRKVRRCREEPRSAC